MKPYLYLLLPICLLAQVPQTEITLTPGDTATISQITYLQTEIIGLQARNKLLQIQVNANSQEIVNIYAAVTGAGIVVPEP